MTTHTDATPVGPPPKDTIFPSDSEYRCRHNGDKDACELERHSGHQQDTYPHSNPQVQAGICPECYHLNCLEPA